MAQHNTTLTPSSMAAEPTANAAHDREYDLWTPLEKNGILLIAVEHGCVLSLLSLHCTGHVSTIDNSAPRPSKRPRKEYCQLKHDNPTLTLNEFAQLYLKASETIIGEALNMQYIVDCPASIRHSNDAGYKVGKGACIRIASRHPINTSYAFLCCSCVRSVVTAIRCST